SHPDEIAGTPRQRVWKWATMSSTLIIFPVSRTPEMTAKSPIGVRAERRVRRVRAGQAPARSQR
ncbi:hypothetical protein, partial [Actinacidiphila acidipaludis]